MEAIDALKQKVLSLAIQGKLVAQDPTDEPASVLLERIKAEKAELVKQGKIKKDKQESYIFRGDDNKYYEKIGTETKDITDEIPFDIPENWEWVRFKDIVLYNMGKTPERGNKRYWSEATIPWVSISDMLPSQHINNTKEKITEIALKEVFKERLSPKGTLLMSFKLTVGRTSILDFDAVHNEAIISIYPYKSLKQDFQEYLLYFLPIFSSLAQSHDAIKGKTLNSKSIDNILIPLPPENEQKRIVNKFKIISITSNNIYENQEELNKLKDGLKNKVLNLAIQGKLVEQDPNDEPASVLLEKIKAEKLELIKQGKIKKDKQESYIYKGADNRHYEKIGSEVRDITDEIPFEIPNSWSWCRLGNVYDVRDGTHDTPKYYSDGIPLVTSKNLCDGKISYTNVKFISLEDAKKINERSYVDNGDILFGMIGTIGKPVIVNKTIEFCIKNVALIKNLFKQNIEYCYFLLLAMEDFMNKNASGGVQPFVSLNYIRKLLIPLPPIQEQQRIIQKLSKILETIEFL